MMMPSTYYRRSVDNECPRILEASEFPAALSCSASVLAPCVFLAVRAVLKLDVEYSVHNGNTPSIRNGCFPCVRAVFSVQVDDWIAQNEVETDVEPATNNDPRNNAVRKLCGES